MQDIEKTCNRLIVIDKGKKIYDDSIEKLLKLHGSIRRLVVEFQEHVPEKLCFEGVKISEIPDNKYRRVFEYDCREVDSKSLIKDLVNNYEVKDISIIEMDIEDVVRNIYEGSVIL